MKQYGQEFWEDCWKRSEGADYSAYLQSYYKKQDPIIDLLKQNHVHYVCDAACGFGAYTLMLASNGFRVEGFDISATSVEVTRSLLQKYGIDTSKFKVASVLDTGYDEMFDAVTACSVLDHLYVCDAEKAMHELLRIVKPGGSLWFPLMLWMKRIWRFPMRLQQTAVFCTPKEPAVVWYFTATQMRSWENGWALTRSFYPSPMTGESVSLLFKKIPKPNLKILQWICPA